MNIDDIMPTILQGSIRGIRKGLSHVEVQERLGVPDDKSRGKIRIWKYGNVQIAFSNGSVDQIAQYFRRPINLNAEETKLISFADLMELFKLRGIHYQQIHNLSFDNQIGIEVLPTRVTLLIADGYLDSLYI